LSLVDFGASAHALALKLSFVFCVSILY